MTQEEFTEQLAEIKSHCNHWGKQVKEASRRLASRAGMSKLIINDVEARYLLFSGKEVTLDGEPAKIIGFHNRFATVATLGHDGPYREAQFAWPTVQRIVETQGGQFKS